MYKFSIPEVPSILKPDLSRFIDRVREAFDQIEESSNNRIIDQLPSCLKGFTFETSTTAGTDYVCEGVEPVAEDPRVRLLIAVGNATSAVTFTVTFREKTYTLTTNDRGHSSITLLSERGIRHPVTVSPNATAVEFAVFQFVPFVATIDQLARNAEQSLSSYGSNLEVASNGITLTPRTTKLNFIGFDLEETSVGEITITAASVSEAPATTESLLCLGHEYTYIDSTNWKIEGANEVEYYRPGRRVRFAKGSAAYYGAVVDSELSGTETLIEMEMEGGSTLPTTADQVCFVNNTERWAPIEGEPFGNETIFGLATGAMAGAQWWVAIGDYGKIFTSTDKGETWTERDSGTTNRLISVYYNETLQSFLVGGWAGVIRRTTDGVTWSNPNDLSEEWDFDTGTGGVKITKEGSSGYLYAAMQKGGASYRTYSGIDGSSIGWVARDVYVNGDVYDLVGHKNINQIEVSRALYANWYRFNGHLDTSIDFRFAFDSLITSLYTWVGTGAITDSPKVYIGLGNGEIHQYYIAGGQKQAFYQSKNTTVFREGITDFAVSGAEGTAVVVGANGAIATSSVDNDPPAHGSWEWTYQQNGFPLTEHIMAVEYNSVDDTWVAVGDRGTICRTTVPIYDGS